MFKIILKALCLALVVGLLAHLFFSCKTLRPFIDDDAATCADVCGHARELGCELARGAPGDDLVYGMTPGDPAGADDIPCELVCETLFGDGSFWDKDCLVQVALCAEMDKCGE
jgi:hypothetical protein